MKNIFITGISDFWAPILSTFFWNRNRVTGLIRNPEALQAPEMKISLLKGNLFDDYSTIFSDTDIVIHIAAETRQNILQYEDYYKTNYEAIIYMKLL
jgi:nucleoside-diphosphate-sugar epimerase